MSLRSPVVLQAKLTVGDPVGVYEQEADQVADQVMRMPDPGSLQRTPCACGGSCPRCAAETAQRQIAKRQTAQGQTARGQTGRIGQPAGPTIAEAATDVSLLVAHGTSGGGQAIDEDTRAFMEPRFGRDFGHVRVHADAAAAASARAINAAAYAVGDQIVFGAGRYAPGTSEGRRLLAHELTHTVQQGAVAPDTISRSIARPISTGAMEIVQRTGECDGKPKGSCFGGCVPADGRGTGFCAWSGTIKYGCICYRRDQPMLRAVEQALFNLVIAALIVAGIVLTAAAIAAIIACLLGPCEAAALIAALGFGAAMIVLGIIGAGGAGAGSGAGPAAEAGNGGGADGGAADGSATA